MIEKLTMDSLKEVFRKLEQDPNDTYYLEAFSFWAGAAQNQIIKSLITKTKPGTEFKGYIEEVIRGGSMNLYEIDSAIAFMLDQIMDEETGEITGDLSLLEKLEQDKHKKACNIGWYIKNTKADINAYKIEEERLRKSRQSLEKKVAFLKDCLADSLHGDKVKDVGVSIYWGSSESVQGAALDHPESLPEEFKKVSIEAKKSDIKKHLKLGGKLPGCKIVKNTHIVIK